MDTVKFIGKIHSSLEKIEDCPLQESEGAPEVIISIDPEYRPALSGLKAGDKLILLTWLHRANRETLTTKPRNNPNAKTRGVFATRSPDRPNPIGLHSVDIVAITKEGEIRISNLEVLNGTPVVDIKPVF